MSSMDMFEVPQSRLEELTNEIKRLQTELSQARRNCVREVELLATEQEEHAATRARAERAEQDVIVLRSELVEANSRADTYHREIEQWQAERNVTQGNCDAWLARAEQLQTELAESQQRNDLFSNCLHRALLLWKERHPDSDYWPDGADNIAWLVDEVELMRSRLRVIAGWDGDFNLWIRRKIAEDTLKHNQEIIDEARAAHKDSDQ